MVPAECNYEIYDKELLAIVRYLEHWRPELELTNIPVQIFTDHKSLEYFIQIKELTRRQARWAEKLAEYNFKIMYRTGKSNRKADTLTRMPNSILTNKEDERLKHQHRALLSPECFQGYNQAPSADQETEGGGEATDEQINAMTDEELLLYARITLANQDDEECCRVRDAMEKDLTQIFEGINLRHCSQRHYTLFYKDRLWVPISPKLYLDIIREGHDQPASGHLGRDRTLEILKRQFYWPGMKEEVARYIRNCYTYQRSKAPRDKYNGLLQPLPTPEQRWQDISMDFVTSLSTSEGQNAIYTLVDRLSKEKHYAPCTTADKGTSIEAIVDILLNYIFRTHGLLNLIVSDRGP